MWRLETKKRDRAHFARGVEMLFCADALAWALLHDRTARGTLDCVDMRQLTSSDSLLSRVDTGFDVEALNELLHCW